MEKTHKHMCVYAKRNRQTDRNIDMTDKKQREEEKDREQHRQTI